jgi:hypothetical protein
MPVRLLRRVQDLFIGRFLSTKAALIVYNGCGPAFLNYSLDP